MARGIALAVQRQGPRLDNRNISGSHDLIVPADLRRDLPLSDKAQNTVFHGRRVLVNCMTGRDGRIILVVGPCSIHDIDAAKEYAQRLYALSQQVKDVFTVVMRVYFEKPRTRKGWRGLIYEPRLDGKENISDGLRMARELLVFNAEMGLLSGTEFVDTFVPQYISDAIAWAAIGARTAESPLHRQMASGLSMLTGNKNTTQGSIKIAIDAMIAAGEPQWFYGPDMETGKGSVFLTTGNVNTHLVLRGGQNSPNYHARNVREAVILLSEEGLHQELGIDCSHDNTLVEIEGKMVKDYSRQGTVFNDVIGQIRGGNRSIKLLMLESNLLQGSQRIPAPKDLSRLVRGVSVTDGCIGWEETAELILHAHKLLRQ